MNNDQFNPFGENYDATTVDTSQQFEVLPEGRYILSVESSTRKPTKKAEEAGEEMPAYERICFQVLEGEHAGKKLFKQFNLYRDQDKAKEIAHKDLACLCKAVGVARPRSMDDLLNKTFMADVVVKPAEKGSAYGPQNEIKNWYTINGEHVNQAARGASAPGSNQRPVGQPRPAAAPAQRPAAPSAARPAAPAPGTAQKFQPQRVATQAGGVAR